MSMYKEVRAAKDSYTSDDSIDFLLKIDPGMELVKGSVYLCGYLKFRKTNANTKIVFSDDVNYDHYAGIANFFDNFVTELRGPSGSMIIENLGNYPRYVKQQMICTQSSKDLGTNSKHQQELRCSIDAQSRYLLIGDDTTNQTMFSHKLKSAVNRSNRNINDKDVDSIYESFRFRNLYKSVYGAQVLVQNFLTYTVTDLKLVYKVQPAQPTNIPLIFNIVSNERHTLSSAVTNLELEVPVASKSVSSTFANVSAASPNNVAYNDMLVSNPNITRIDYKFNDSNSRLVSFTMDNNKEILSHYLYSMNGTQQSHDLRQNNLNGTFGIGLNFFGLIPPKTKVSVEIHSNANTNQIYNLYNFYNGVVEVPKMN